MSILKKLPFTPFALAVLALSSIGYSPSGSAKEGGSNSHGGDLVFFMNADDALAIAEYYLGRSDCANETVTAALASPDALAPSSTGDTPFAKFAGERIERLNAADSRLLSGLSVIVKRGTGRDAPEALKQVEACLKQ